MERRYYLNNVRKAVCHGVKEFSADEVREALGVQFSPGALIVDTEHFHVMCGN